MVFLKIEQQLPETFFARSAGAAPRTLAGDVNQLCDTLPARTARRSILAVSKELLSLSAGLETELVGFVVVGDVEVVDVLAGFLDGAFLLFVRNFTASGNICITLFTPLPTERTRLVR